MYYLVVEEWNYPTESGREPCLCTFDSREEAMEKCAALARDERDNLMRATQMPCLDPVTFSSGVMVATANEEPFYYYARAVKVTPGL